MSDSNNSNQTKILIIRMLGLGDVTCIGIPALRFVQQQNPDAEIHFLSYAAGLDVIRLAAPEIKVFGLEKDQWPDNIVFAMETFLGLAEAIVGEGYQQIINLDTWFMPCFLARFLKDAGEPVAGNMMSISVGSLVDQFQQQTLKPEYVNDPAVYLQSTWFGMHQWHTPWWQNGHNPDGGYPEFYLRNCCSFNELKMDMSIDVLSDSEYLHIAEKQPIVALACNARTIERNYPYAAELKQLLEENGIYVWTGFDGSISMEQTLARLKASNLLISVPSAPQWLAAAVGCPSLIISGQVDPRTLMPDYATDMSSTPIEPAIIINGVLDILKGEKNA